MSLFQQLQIAPDSVEITTVPFGEWLPDMPAMNNPGAVEALNVIPAEGSYVPFAAFEAATNGTLPSVARGATAVFSPDDSIQVYAGSLNGIYTRETGAFVKVYTSTLPLSMEFAWQFVRVGDSMVAIHQQVAPVAANVGGFTAFTPLGGSPPTAGCGAQVGDFLMLGNLVIDPADSGGSFPSRVRWGGFNNIDLPWITDPATQADFQDQPADGGPVVGIVGREFATIFQSRMIRRATYVGPPDIFDFETVENKRGALARDGIVDIGSHIFYPAEDGFFIWNGTNSTPISDNKVGRYFMNRLAYAYRSRIVGAVDFANSSVMWAFPTDSTGALNELLIFSWRENKWSHAFITMESIFNSASSSVSIDDLTLPLESYTDSFDGGAYRGGRVHLAGFDQLHRYGMFTGDPLAATIDTGEFSGPDGRRVFVNGVYPVVDLPFPAATVQVAQRDQMIGEPVAFTSAVAQENTGVCPVLADARLMRFRLNIPASAVWRHATGVDVHRKPTGIV